VKALIVVFVGLIALLPVGGDGAAWRGKRVVVRDHTPVAWQPLVERAIAAFNTAMPPEVPRLIYQRRKERRCRSLPDTGRRGSLALCADDGRELALWWGWAEYRVERGGIIPSAKISLYSGMPEGEVGPSLCHELMHALTNADHSPFREDSCVRGHLSEPGAWDVAFARRAYRKHR
jgi:hypothetical protein